jgi:hypothetical protein
VGADVTDAGELDVAAVGAEAEGAGGDFEVDQLDRAVARLASPHEYASLLFCAHHGARTSFASFHARRRLYAENDTSGVSWSSGMS